MMCLPLHIDPVHCNHPVAGPQSGRLCGRTILHFADELSALPFLTVQVKSISVLCLCHETKPRFPLAGHVPHADEIRV